MDKLSNLIASAKAYIAKEPKVAMVYLEQASDLARELGFHYEADELFSLYVEAKVMAWG